MTRLSSTFSYKLIFATGIALALLFGACGDGNPGSNASDAHTLPQTDATADPPFTITQLQPNHGTVNGGTEVVVRGFGFADGSLVHFGTQLADPSFTIYEGPNRIRVLTPLGSPGPVDVKVIRPDGDTAIFADGYTYDNFYVDPPTGSTSGGTFVRLVGADTDWGPSAVALFDGEPLDQQIVVSPKLITGRTMAHLPGSVAVRIEDAGNVETIQDAYTFFDGSDPINGGLGGGEINGEVRVTVVDVYTREPVVDAFVLMGSDATSPYQGLTDSLGKITFSAPGLSGPQMVTAAAEEYETTSVVAFDAADVTIFLYPFIPPSPGSIPGQALSLVTGFVDFGGVEFGESCEFDEYVPAPQAGERRIIKVYQTQPAIDFVAPEPDDGGTIVEGDPCIGGYEYYIYARPGSYAVYAMAGIEVISTGAFTPYAMGVARGLLSGPDEVIQANIRVDLQNNMQLKFDMSTAPPLDPVWGPGGYKISVFVDLGSDGFVIRQDTQRSPTSIIDPIAVDRLPPLERGLNGGQYTAMLEAHNFGMYSFSNLYKNSLFPGLDPTPVVVDDWLGIPQPVDPVAGGTPTTTRMIFDAVGAEPTFNIIVVQLANGDPYWTLFTHGAVKQFVLPDLFGLGTGLEGHPAGGGILHIIPVKVDGLDFDDFSYLYLNDRYWSGSAGNGYFFNFPQFGN